MEEKCLNNYVLISKLKLNKIHAELKISGQKCRSFTKWLQSDGNLCLIQHNYALISSVFQLFARALILIVGFLINFARPFFA
jgi:hypothetical protein